MRNRATDYVEQVTLVEFAAYRRIPAFADRGEKHGRLQVCYGNVRPLGAAAACLLKKAASAMGESDGAFDGLPHARRHAMDGGVGGPQCEHWRRRDLITRSTKTPPCGGGVRTKKWVEGHTRTNSTPGLAAIGVFSLRKPAGSIGVHPRFIILLHTSPPRHSAPFPRFFPCDQPALHSSSFTPSSRRRRSVRPSRRSPPTVGPRTRPPPSPRRTITCSINFPPRWPIA